MSGILNNKQRIVDTVLTLNGRRNLAIKGGLDIAYVTFSDACTFYQVDLENGSSDVTVRPYLESCSLPQDTITFVDAGTDGAVSAFPSLNGFDLIDGNVTTVDTSQRYPVTLSPSQVRDEALNIVSSSLDALQRINVIRTSDGIFEQTDFSLAPENVNFVLSDKSLTAGSMDVNSIEEVFCDPRFNNELNFMYLPPLSGSPDGKLLGDYKPWGITAELTLDVIQSELALYSATTKKLSCEPTSINNKCVAQFFEVDNGKIKKLEVVDVGSFNAAVGTVHVYFLGKSVQNDYGIECFVHLFTLTLGDA